MHACAAACQVAANYLESNPKIPWDDLRYIFGEIMYGGHITDDFDRRLCGAYLRAYMTEKLLEGEEFYPGFRPAPAGLNCKQVVSLHIESEMPQESPIAFGLHPNAEIASGSSRRTACSPTSASCSRGRPAAPAA